MTNRVLLVDGDLNLLASMQRQFRGIMDVETAPSGDDALPILDSKGRSRR